MSVFRSPWRSLKPQGRAHVHPTWDWQNRADDYTEITDPDFLWLLFCPPFGLTGISGDKVEIDPVTNQKASTKFWIKQKPISIDSDLLCACDLAEEKSPSE